VSRSTASAWPYITALLVTAVCAASGAQDTAPATPAVAEPTAARQPAAQPRFRTEANFVRVDAYPTHNGQPVTDLTADDFQILEDGTRQRIATFEHVQLHERVPEDVRKEPESASEGRAAAEDSRARVFVIFLDTYHTPVEGSHAAQRVLVNMLDRLIGPDDVFAVMTPKMSATDITLARRTKTIEGELTKYWYWGEKDRLTPPDPEDRDLEAFCAPAGQGDARELIARRHEKLTMDALTDLARYLRGVREERKAVIAVTSGWVLYRPDEALLHASSPLPPQVPRVGTGPDGRLTGDTAQAHQSGPSSSDCEGMRIQLASLDIEDEFRHMLEDANRGNVSFYPVDARGLAATDERMGPSDFALNPGQAQILARERGTVPGDPMTANEALLHTRLQSLRTLADVTDGIAIVDTNDLNRGMRRVVADLSSYYLLGYYSTNSRLDGGYRSLKVKVTRPGVDVRARRGYRAATEAEIERARSASQRRAAAGPPAALQAAFATLAVTRRDTRLSTHVAWLAVDEGAVPVAPRLWADVEIDPALGRSIDAGGAVLQAAAIRDDGAVAAQGRSTRSGSSRVFQVPMTPSSLQPGSYTLRVHLSAAGELPVTETVPFAIREGQRVGARILRAGGSPAMPFVPTGDVRFRRTERLRVDVPVAGKIDRVDAALLDRNGGTISISVDTETQAADGLAWASALLALAPLAPGDYAIQTTIEHGSSTEQVMTAFRVVP
jgi:VWFA-related protein